MIKAIFFDCDKVVVKREMYFSQRLLKDLGVVLDAEKVRLFFQNEFLLCETGQADLKTELQKQIAGWGWTKSVDELLEYWFSGERQADKRMVAAIGQLRSLGIGCFMSSDNEKYRLADLKAKVRLDRILDRLFFSCELGFLKSQPQFWHKVMEALAGRRAEEILVWDDDKKIVDLVKSLGLGGELFTDYEKFKQTMGSKYGLGV